MSNRRMRSRKMLAALLSFAISFSLLSGCSGEIQPETAKAKSLRASVPTADYAQTMSLAFAGQYSDKVGEHSDSQVYYEEDIVQLLKGASLLAAGGGGSLSLGLDIFEEFKVQNPDVSIDVEICNVNEMNEDASTFGVGIMGSPSAHASISDLAKVSLLAYEETLALAERYGKNAEYAMALELGGANTLVPLLCAMKHDLKVVNADLCGRAVPGLETALSSINGLPTSPFALTDSAGNSYDIIMADPYDAAGVESVAIAILNKLESNGGFTGYFYSKHDLENNVPTDSLTRCIEIGRCIETFESLSIEERKEKSLFTRLNELEMDIQCHTLNQIPAKVTEFHQEPAAGGARDKGYYYIGTGEPGDYFYVQFSNETMAVSVLTGDGVYECIATAPDIITMYDVNTGLPLTNADLKAHYDDGTIGDLDIVLGIVKSDDKWWNNMSAVIDAWKPYWEEAGYTGDFVPFEFDNIERLASDPV